MQSVTCPKMLELGGGGRVTATKIYRHATAFSRIATTMTVTQTITDKAKRLPMDSVKSKDCDTPISITSPYRCSQYMHFGVHFSV